MAAVLALVACGSGEEEVAVNETDDQTEESMTSEDDKPGSSEGSDEASAEASEEDDTQPEESEESTIGSDGEEASGENEEDNGFERFEYEGAYPGIGIAVESSEEDLENDMIKFIEVIEGENGHEYTFNLENVGKSLENNVNVNYHYERFAEVVAKAHRDLQRLELETDEWDFARQEYLKAIESHRDAAEKLEPHAPRRY
ncbi:hypothetical protein JSY36_09225 [Bacillus sp. H-16]|uniref:hypothetical protein n=1 Tax=Alteribacter salitolerans TaxID=2912333 RepID=UPI001964E457|nr:hypothetical protein [Alteribacter salitolerans]MBM7095935.1 hypothetical protein [Alteribacter salitolerans]